MLTSSRILLTAALLAIGCTARAQCTFTPTVTPSNLIMCPNTQDTLRTQAYDSYQWYKDGNPIAGATRQTLPIDQFTDAGSQFSVEATQNGCTEMSAQVLVDGWVFAGLTVMSSGNFATDPQDGHAIICDSSALHPRDTVTFELLQPYNTNVQWYRNGQPISGANSVKLEVTESGIYEVEGAPAVCPRFSSRSLPLEVELRRPLPPGITLNGGQLVIVPPTGVTYSRYEWYCNGVQVPGATGSTLSPPNVGSYRVQGDDGMCWAVSDAFPFLIAGLSPTLPNAAIRLYPNPAGEELLIESATPLTATLRTLAGTLVLHQPHAQRLDLRALPAGLYFVHLTDATGRVVRVEKLVKAAL